MFYTKDAGEIFLDKGSVDLFFMNPPYFGSFVEEYEYSGDLSDNINYANTKEEYIKKLIPLMKHVEHSLSQSGSAFIMVPNDENNIILHFYNMIKENTNLKIGSLFVWDFSETEEFKDLVGEKMAIIAHLHNGDYYVQEDILEYIHKIKFEPFRIKKYSDIGLIDASLPEELYERFIKMFSKPGDTVADLVAGTGSIVVPASKLGRNFIYNDLSEKQAQIAKARLRDWESQAI